LLRFGGAVKEGRLNTNHTGEKPFPDKIQLESALNLSVFNPNKIRRCSKCRERAWQNPDYHYRNSISFHPAAGIPQQESTLVDLVGVLAPSVGLVNGCDRIFRHVWTVVCNAAIFSGSPRGGFIRFIQGHP
jgi:hypothetical protein